jgi:glucose-6-phosphate isomerase
MKPFLLNGRAEFQKPVTYYMYRNVGFRKDEEILNKNRLRYDITVLESGKIGQEFVKTIGHYHAFKPRTKVRYLEIYKVIYGQAIFVMQEVEVDERKVKNVYLATATAPSKVVMLPVCGHVTVNIGSENLVLANIVSDQFASIYGSYREMKVSQSRVQTSFMAQFPSLKSLCPKMISLASRKELLYT